MTTTRAAAVIVYSAMAISPLGPSLHHHLFAGALEPINCFTNCPPKKRHQRTQMVHMESSSTLESGSSLQGTDGPNGSEFNLQKALLMARFASVAYEDPPKNAGTGMARMVEQFTDSAGVTITRRKMDNESEQQVHRRTVDVENIDNEWSIAHVQAMSPRPLLDMMLLECNKSGIPSEDDSLAKSQFEWIALATNKKTSTQFDVWRITTSSSEESQTNKNILVVAFRGTRLSSYLELYTDLQLQQDMISCVDFGVCMNDETMSANNNNSLMAHSGFLKAYASIRPSLFQLLSDSASIYDSIWFTGHSLGAALATLAVVDVGSVMMNDESNLKSTSMDQKLKLPKANISSYLYGTPRVGNLAFAEHLAQLQSQPEPIVQEYYRINTAGDAVVFLPRGKVANRLAIDYVHAGASVFLPALAPESDNEKSVSDDKTAEMEQSYRQWMMQLEEDTIEQINKRIFRIKEGTTKDNLSSKVRVYSKGDQPPDPLSEIDPDYSGFFPIDPRTWISSTSFQDFLLGETVRSFRILRGGFIKNHQLKTYENVLCQASQDNVLVVNQ